MILHGAPLYAAAPVGGGESVRVRRVQEAAWRAQLNMRTATPAITQYVSDPAGAEAAAASAKAKPGEGAR